MNDFGTFYDSTPQDIRSSTPSLAIAIDLDAMLEHEKRHRRSHAFDDNIRPSTSSNSFAFSTGLPPPPRRNARAGLRSSGLRDFSSVNSSPTRSSGTTGSSFPFSVPTTPDATVSNPYINPVPRLPRNVELNGRIQSPGFSTYPPIAPGVSGSLELASDRGVDPLETHSHDLFISFRSRGTPTSTSYSLPRMEKVAGKGKSLSSQIDSQVNFKGEQFTSGYLKVPSDSSSLPSVQNSESQKEIDETIPTRLLTAQPRPADEPTALAESSSQNRSHSSESASSPLAHSTQQPISISSATYFSYGSDSQNRHQISGLNDSYGYHTSTSSSPSRDSSVDSATSSPVFASSFDRSPISSPIDLPRSAFYNDRSGARLGSSNRCHGSSTQSAAYPAKSLPLKPPLPTTPKPNFRRSASRPPSNKSSRRPSPTRDERLNPMPPTSNLLDPQERADLVKKSRKLAQMFGKTPGATILSQKYDELQTNFSLPLAPGPIQYLASGRRHSEPFSPDTLHDNMGDYTLAGNCRSTQESLDLSQEGNSSTSSSSFAHTESRHLGLQHSPSTPSLGGTSTVAEQEEADRKRKRDQLAKLHRFLGSRVPIGLILGLESGDMSLPPVAPQSPDSGSKADPASKDVEHRKLWLPRRRSSADMYRMSSQDLDRLKEDLSDEEKAINVRRAQKMEKVFGVLPPQILYHTRCSPSPTHLSSPVPPSSGRWTAPSSPISQSRNQSQVFERNPNQSAYKSKSRKHDRPGTPESMQGLLPGCRNSSFYFNSQDSGHLNVYTHYQHSLHSLNDIIERDDRASLVELHQYLQGEIADPSSQGRTANHSGLVLGSTNMGRRRSLPDSVLSHSTAETSVTNAKPEPTDFQLRRRKAAKLTQFFGVDYKQIIHDVLESIEKGVEEERKRGTLQPEEVEVLLQKVNTLKTKRSAIL